MNGKKSSKSNPSGNCLRVSRHRTKPGLVHVYDDKEQKAYGPSHAGCIHYTEQEFDNGNGVGFSLVNTASVPRDLRDIWDAEHPEQAGQEQAWYAVYGKRSAGEPYALYFTVDERDAFREGVLNGEFAAEEPEPVAV